ncbi:hypothetical protein RFI_38443 [Reticulomyxa filosa]|uniref:Uncharacterized protein n=1 Tax=Reticulomyxa filosa TaxID=46433 RepID=X6LAJ8_RETFI|nr:hypothetical protein RFI_38443 [Reticulomyxa filosa]|eukprot:ETN99047.1 hypothetical protein RFI_38443 [Reticulomyxa filosa]
MNCLQMKTFYNKLLLNKSWQFCEKLCKHFFIFAHFDLFKQNKLVYQNIKKIKKQHYFHKKSDKRLVTVATSKVYRNLHFVLFLTNFFTSYLLQYCFNLIIFFQEESDSANVRTALTNGQSSTSKKSVRMNVSNSSQQHMIQTLYKSSGMTSSNECTSNAKDVIHLKFINDINKDLDGLAHGFFSQMYSHQLLQRFEYIFFQNITYLVYISSTDVVVIIIVLVMAFAIVTDMMTSSNKLHDESQQVCSPSEAIRRNCRKKRAAHQQTFYAGSWHYTYILHQQGMTKQSRCQSLKQTLGCLFIFFFVLVVSIVIDPKDHTWKVMLLFAKEYLTVCLLCLSKQRKDAVHFASTDLH